MPHNIDGVLHYTVAETAEHLFGVSNKENRTKVVNLIHYHGKLDSTQVSAARLVTQESAERYKRELEAEERQQPVAA